MGETHYRSPRLKRAYEAPAAADGTRILVERLWPRGLGKKAARVEHWLKDLSPSPELRKWYAHDQALWPEFRRRYERELAANEAAIEELLSMCRAGPVTLVFAAKDPQHSSARVLRDHLDGKARR